MYSPARGAANRRLAAVFYSRPVWQITIPAGRTPRWLCWTAAQLLGIAWSLGVLTGGLWLTWRLAAGPLGLRAVPGCYYFHAYQPDSLTPCPLWTDFWSWRQWGAAWSTAWSSGRGPAFVGWLATWFAAATVTEWLIGFRVTSRRRRPN